MYLVFRCRKCGRYIYARDSNKTRKCVCGYTNSLNRVLVVAKVEDERLAAELVRQKQGSGTDFVRLG
ncbi:DUF1922 domain-containing protein [Archaeoglobales archaeon]|nr:MAG: DUF1922 domain-containing protein [Archaeoglobales archaeon]